MAHFLKSYEWTRPNQAKRMKSGPKRAKKRKEARNPGSTVPHSRKGSAQGSYKVTPSKRHGSFPTAWKADPLGQKG